MCKELIRLPEIISNDPFCVRHMLKQLAAIPLAVALLGAEAGAACAQTNASSAASADLDQNMGNAGAPRAERRMESGNVGAGGDKGTITRATKDKPGHIGEDGSLPKPVVRDDPQHRCLSPAGIC